MEVSFLHGHRKVPPYGMAGGAQGECGQSLKRLKNGKIEKRQGCDQFTCDAGEAIIIKTPSGGGYGKPQAKRPAINPRKELPKKKPSRKSST